MKILGFVKTTEGFFVTVTEKDFENFCMKLSQRDLDSMFFLEVQKEVWNVGLN